MHRYLPGIVLLLITLIIGFLTNNDYGLGCDEGPQRLIGILNYVYIKNHDNTLLTFYDRQYGVGFELPLIFIEKLFKLRSNIEIYPMRHVVSHAFFLISTFYSYLLVLKIFKNQYIACLGFIMIAFCPIIYAHSFFNTKDVPLAAMYIISAYYGEMAFRKNKTYLYLFLGMICGLTTCVRILGILSIFIFLLFLFLDLVTAFVKKENIIKASKHLLLFVVGFVLIIYICTPYYWHHPIANFIESYYRMSHFKHSDVSLLYGKFVSVTNLPWYYIPVWFLITNPEIWLICGVLGIILLFYNFIRSPLDYILQKQERNFTLYAFCFFAPIAMVIILNSTLYDGWRHLFFIYPFFIFIALFFINKVINLRFNYIIKGLCIIQIVYIWYFMIANHPFQNVYFNSFVSHKKEFLRKNFELDYWAVSYKKALAFLLKKEQSGNIYVSGWKNGTMILFNYNMLPEADKNRIILTSPENAQYYITNYRWHPQDYPYLNEVYSIPVLNSKILSIYKLK